MKDKLPRPCFFPEMAAVGISGNLIIRGCDTVEIAANFSNPLNDLDETTLRNEYFDYFQKIKSVLPQFNSFLRLQSLYQLNYGFFS